VDISEVQVARARDLVPAARFLCADMTALDFPAGSFEAIVSFFAIIHVPLDEQPAILKNIHRWLKPGGYLLATVGSGAWTGTENDWHGAPMYWSHFDAQTNLRLIEEAGFQIRTAQEETAEEHGQPATFLWVIARKDGKRVELYTRPGNDTRRLLHLLRSLWHSRDPSIPSRGSRLLGCCGHRGRRLDRAGAPP